MNKPFYKSRGVMGPVISAGVVILVGYGIVTQDEADALIGDSEKLIALAVSVIGSVVGIIGRIKAQL